MKNQKTELKTLKDIFEGFNSNLEEKNENKHKTITNVIFFILREIIRQFEYKLKAEAVKWVKFHNGRYGTDYQVRKWIRHFFNLTEEDLK